MFPIISKSLNSILLKKCSSLTYFSFSDESSSITLFSSFLVCSESLSNTSSFFFLEITVFQCDSSSSCLKECLCNELQLSLVFYSNVHLISNVFLFINLISFSKICSCFSMLSKYLLFVKLKFRTLLISVTLTDFSLGTFGKKHGNSLPPQDYKR